MKEYNGAIAIIANKDKDLFYLQKKTDTYPVEKYRNGIGFWGGEIENSETPIEAMKRELKEELGGISSIVIPKISEVGKKSSKFEGRMMNITLYEAIFDDRELELLSKCKVYEGIGFLVKKNDLDTKKLIFNLAEIYESYIHGKFS